jgi:integrase
MATALTARSVSKLKPRQQPYYVADDLIPGLAVRVAIDGSKSWSIRYRMGKRMRRLTLGGDELTLADARERARNARKKVTGGDDPAEVKQQRREADTVETFAETFLEQHAKKRKRWKAVKSRLDNDILPRWRHKLMRDVTRADVRELIDAIAARPAPISANRVRALLSKMFNVAIQRDVVDANPVVGTARPGIEQRRDRVLTPDEIRQFWKASNALPLEMRAAWQLRLLTAQRATEVHDMTWNEVDLTTGWWTIPAARSKNGMTHRVPLSLTALKLLKDLKTAADERRTQAAERRNRRGDQLKADEPDYVLEGARAKKAQAAAANTFGIDDFHGHDLRRTAASLMTSSGTPRLVVSKVLNHSEPGVTAVYDRHSYDDEKKIALDAWARTLAAVLKGKRGSNVLAFAGRG